MATSMLVNLNQEITQEELLAENTLLLKAILARLARIDVNGREFINLTETTLPTVTTVTGVTTVSTVTNVGSVQNSGALNRDNSAIPMHMSNAGCMHIYNNIIVV